LTLDVLEDTIEKLLFWLPHAETDDGAEGDVSDGIHGDAAWREVGYGILSLHRLSLDLALDDDNENSNSSSSSELCSTKSLRKNHYGMSIRTKNSPTIAATSVRICLTVIHSLMPSLISLVMLRARRQTSYTNNGVYNSVNNSNNSHRKIAVAASKARLVLEQAKFLLRMTLLVHYWRQQQQQQQQQNYTQQKQIKDDSATISDFGVMLDGGMYHSDRAQESIGIPWDHARALQRRRNYVGERTGWNVTKSSTAASCKTGLLSDHWSRIVRNLFGNNNFDRNYRNAKTVLAELLYFVRPLLWAWLESRHHAYTMTSNREPTWPIAIRNRPGASSSNHSETTKARRRPILLKGWLLCLAMDVLSIRLLEHHRQPNPHYPASTSDPFAHEELKRRKMRLLLYLLRAPVWNDHTLPVLEGVSQKVLRRMPLLGNLLETVLWDWILYYQHPFASEEG